MKLTRIIIPIVLKAIALSFFLIPSFTYESSLTVNSQQLPKYYQQRALHSRDGIGKFYLGREIAKVMGHQEMLWLERPSRENQEKPNQVVDALQLEIDDIVADIGAGTGYFTFRIAQKLPQGKVLAVDIQPEMLDVINFIIQDNHVENVEAIQGSETSPNLAPASIDLALMVDAYHEFAYPREIMTEIFTALKPGGKVVLVEYRGENPLIPIKALHKMTETQVQKEMGSVGLQWVKTQEFLPQQHYLVFQKPTT